MDITTICGMHNRIIGMDMSGILLHLGSQRTHLLLQIQITHKMETHSDDIIIRTIQEQV